MSALRIVLVDRQDRQTTDELMTGLLELGHSVSVVSETSPGRVEARLARRGYEPGLSSLPSLVAQIARARPDVAHAFTIAGALAAALGCSRSRRAVVATLLEPPTREWLLARRRRLEAVRHAVGAGAAIVVADEESAAALRWSMGVGAVVIHPGCATGHASLYRQLIG